MDRDRRKVAIARPSWLQSYSMYVPGKDMGQVRIHVNKSMKAEVREKMKEIEEEENKYNIHFFNPHPSKKKSACKSKVILIKKGV